MKAVVNNYENSYEIIIPRNCDKIDVNDDRYSNERSITVYRLTVRKLCKQSKINYIRPKRLNYPTIGLNVPPERLS